MKTLMNKEGMKRRIRFFFWEIFAASDCWLGAIVVDTYVQPTSLGFCVLFVLQFS